MSRIKTWKAFNELNAATYRSAADKLQKKYDDGAKDSIDALRKHAVEMQRRKRVADREARKRQAKIDRKAKLVEDYLKKTYGYFDVLTYEQQEEMEGPTSFKKASLVGVDFGMAYDMYMNNLADGIDEFNAMLPVFFENEKGTFSLFAGYDVKFKDTDQADKFINIFKSDKMIQTELNDVLENRINDTEENKEKFLNAYNKFLNGLTLEQLI